MKPDTRMDEEYALLDSGDGKKLERFGRVVLSRPCAQAVWKPVLPAEEWARADAAFAGAGPHAGTCRASR